MTTPEQDGHSVRRLDVKQGFSALVVDDDDFSRRTAVRILQCLGAGSVTEAADGDEALACAVACPIPFDLIVCDLRMPQLDGIETLRGFAAANHSALIVLASGADPRVLRSAREMATRFGIKSLRTIEKPVTPQKLRSIFDEFDGELPAAASLPGPAGPELDAVTVDDIRRGLAANEFVAYFQPKVAMATKRVTGAEALVRWVHPTSGLLPPSTFLPVAHAAGLLGEFTDLMFAKAVVRCAGWRRSGLDVSVSINLPIACLTSRDLPPRLEAIAAGSDLAPEHVTLEVTEDGWLQNAAVACEVLTRLRLRGFSLSIDDFGTGYSTIQQLLQAPFSEMKIDQSFVRSAPDDEESAVVLASSINLAHRLRLTVVAEGAETDVHWRLLERAGCDAVQGYVVARPMPGGAFTEWLAGWERKVAGQRAVAL